MNFDLEFDEALEEIKRRREKLGLTQAELAKRADVSQPLIARLESKKNRVDTTLSTYLKIVKVLDEIEHKKITAESVFHSPIISVVSSDSIEKAVNLMEVNEISQLPVIDDGFQVGSISERAVVRAISRGNSEEISRMCVEELMEEAFPVIPLTVGLDVLFPLLEHHAAVLVQKRGGKIGIITKRDVMTLIHR